MKTKPLGHYRVRAGFSLIELLVAIAIIVILAGLLLPVLTQAKAKSHGVACAGNLRQLGLALSLYTGDNAGVFPRNIAEGSGSSENWRSVEGWALGNARRDLTDDNLRAGVLWKYVGNAGSYKCPTARSNVLTRADLRRFRSYSLSIWLNYSDSIGGQLITHPATIFKDTQTLRPVETFSFICANERSIDVGVFGPWYGPVDEFWWCSTPGELHNRGTYLSFLDGHASRQRWGHVPKRHAGDQGENSENDQDRQDLRWLIEHSPYWDWPQRRPGGPILH